MRILGVLAGALLSLAAPLRGQDRRTATRPDSVAAFPRVEGENLEGRHFVLPQDFEGAVNLVAIAFARHQQEDVDGWMPFLRTLARGRRGVRVYELPTLGRRYRLMRPMIDRGMRGGIPDPAVRAATITLYIDKTPFRRALGISGEERIQVLVVGRDGRVYGRAEGTYSPEAGAELARIVGAIPVGDASGS